MLTSTKIDLPDSLLRGAMYAAEHHTTLTAVVIKQLESLTRIKINEPLVQFSRNLLTKEQAVEAAGLRDYAQLLVALGDADLPMPTLSQAEIDSQAQTFARLLTT